MWPIIKCSSQRGVGPVMDAWPHLVCGVLGGWLVKGALQKILHLGLSENMVYSQ